MSLLLLRCPEVPKIKELAAEIGVNDAVVKRLLPDHETCVLCGLCTRVCRERMGVGAIDFVNRGYKRKVAPPFDEFSPICVTCGACETVCPTGAINLSKVTKKQAHAGNVRIQCRAGQERLHLHPVPAGHPQGACH